MDDDVAGGSFMLSWQTSFNALRVYGNYILPSKWNIKCDVMPMDTANDTDFNIALSKIGFWVENILEDSIIFSGHNEWALEHLSGVSNEVVLCPDDPSDDLLSVLLQSKFNALGAGALEIGFTEVSSDTSNLTFVFAGNSGTILPTMEKWIGKHAYFTSPWWCRDDASSVDTTPPEDANLNNAPEYAASLDFIADAFKEKPKEEQLATIIKHEFRPKVIKGGKGKKK